MITYPKIFLKILIYNNKMLIAADIRICKLTTAD